MCFIDLNAAPQNNEHFADGIYKDHCKSQSLLLQIPGIRKITDFRVYAFSVFRSCEKSS
jgi:hypothetical protein